jgi:hypothetical protein
MRAAWLINGIRSQKQPPFPPGVIPPRGAGPIPGEGGAQISAAGMPLHRRATSPPLAAAWDAKPFTQAMPWPPLWGERVCHCVSKHLLGPSSVGNAVSFRPSALCATAGAALQSPSCGEHEV